MIALLSYSMNLSASESDAIPSTGGQDSVLIAYDDLRKVNAKLIELEYEKEINSTLRTVVSNDSIAISNLKKTINNITIENENKLNKVKRERNIASGVSVGAIILLILSLL